MQSLLETVKIKSQYFLPKKIISRLIGKLAAAEMGTVTTFLIKNFIKYYKVDMQEAAIQNVEEFKTFNDFFTRALKVGARPIAADKKALASPADGMISEYGAIYTDAIIQAKGHYYSLETLLGGNQKDSKIFENGSFITTYLSPKDYHRVHMPLDGQLEKMIYVPGELFSVNPSSAQNIDNLFARNERVICIFKNDQIGRFAVVMVGATIVASIATAFAGTVAPAAKKEIQVTDYTKQSISLKKGEELGRFMLGSTVICVFPKNKIVWNKDLVAEKKIKCGMEFAHIKEKN